MIRVSAQPLESVNRQFAQGADIFVFRGQHAHGFGFFQKIGLGVSCPGDRLVIWEIFN